MSVYWIDGGCKPGPVAYGSICEEWLDPTRELEGLGPESRIMTFQLPQAKTNNEAEYHTLLTLLHHAKLSESDWIFTDSALLVGHLTQGWRVGATNLRPLYVEAATLLAACGAKLRKVDRREIVRKVGH